MQHHERKKIIHPTVHFSIFDTLKQMGKTTHQCTIPDSNYFKLQIQLSKFNIPIIQIIRTTEIYIENKLQFLPQIRLTMRDCYRRERG